MFCMPPISISENLNFSTCNRQRQESSPRQRNYLAIWVVMLTTVLVATVAIGTFYTHFMRSTETFLETGCVVVNWVFNLFRVFGCSICRVSHPLSWRKFQCECCNGESCDDEEPLLKETQLCSIDCNIASFLFQEQKCSASRWDFLYYKERCGSSGTCDSYTKI